MELYKAYDLIDDEGTQRKSDKGIGLKAMGVACEVITKAEDLPENTIRMVASTEDSDRAGDIIRAEGWFLDHYLKNSVVLWGHNHSIPAPTKAANTWVEDIKLLQDWYFDPAYRKANPLSNLLWHGYQPGGPFESSSVGFAPITWQDEFEEGEREELGIGDNGVLFNTQELFEVSAVNVPMNPYALQQLRAKGLDTKPLEELMSIGTVIEIRDEEEENVIKETAKAWDDYLEEELSATNTVITVEELIDHATTVLTNEGYQVITPDEEILTLTETVLELEPEPAIDEAEIKVALAEAYQKKVRGQIKQTIKERINHLLGIVEE